MKFDFILILVASIVELFFFVITFVAVYFSPISKS